MEQDKLYGLKEASEKIGVSIATLRRRVIDKTIPSVYVSRREGYKVTEEELNKFALSLEGNRYYAGRDETKKTKAAAKSKAAKKPEQNAEPNADVKAAEAAEANLKAKPKAKGKSARKTAKPAAKKTEAVKPIKALDAAADATTQMLVGGKLGVALSAIMGAYSAIGELTLPQEDIEKLIKELNSAVVIDKVIERLKAEEEYFDIQTTAQELKSKQAAKKDEKFEAESKLLEYRLKKNQIAKNITDLELRKALLE